LVANRVLQLLICSAGATDHLSLALLRTDDI
jgi:hypothetical protein